MKFDYWVFEPDEFEVSPDRVWIKTMPRTDLWQRTYYGFRNDDAPALLARTSEQFFSFDVCTEFDSKNRFDQCGVIIYQDSDNWFKASTEYENEQFQRLGSVVTNNGYSDWATCDIPSEHKRIFYRLSRRGSDYCVESSFDGHSYKQMRIFHLFEGAGEISVGIYACSPEDSSFTATFTRMRMGECVWRAHS